MGDLPEPLKDQVKTVLKADTRRLCAAYRLSAEEGMKRLKDQARRLEPEHPDAARSLSEGLEETFTINRLGLSSKLRRCLATTNLIESPRSGVRLRTRPVTNWQGGGMVLRWAAGAFLATEANFRRIGGYRELWMLRAVLDEETTQGKEATAA
jgi:transposase-like protein